MNSSNSIEKKNIKSSKNKIIHQKFLTSVKDYWNKIDPVKRITSSEFETIVWQKTRSEILNVLYIGIEDRTIDRSENFRRKVLNANEILYQLKNHTGMKIKKSNLYFHLKELEQIRVIQKVTTKLVKNKYITYYGLTAKNIIPKISIQPVIPFPILNSEKFLPLIKNFTETDSKRLEELVTNLKNINILNDEKIENWLTKNLSIISKIGIDVDKLITLLIFLVNFNEDMFNEFKEVKDFLGLHSN